MKVKFIYEDGRSQVLDFFQAMRFEAKASPEIEELSAGLNRVLHHLMIMDEFPKTIQEINDYWFTTKTSTGIKIYHPFKQLIRHSPYLSIYELRYNHMYSNDPKLYYGGRILFFIEKYKGEDVAFLTRAMIKYQTLDEYLNKKTTEQFNRMIDQTFGLYKDFLAYPELYLLKEGE